MKSISSWSTWGLPSIAAALLLSILTGCSDNSVSQSLSVAPKPEPELTAEQKWLRSLQMITIVNSEGNAVDTDPEWFANRVGEACDRDIAMAFQPLEVEYDPDHWNPLCEPDFLWIKRQTCAAKTLLAAATLQAQPLEFSPSGSGPFKVPPQTEGAAESLAEAAFTRAERAMTTAEFDIKYSGCGTTLLIKDGDEFAYGWADRLTAAYAEAFQTGRDAYDRAVEASVNYSDKMQSSSVSPTQAASRTFSGSALSRAAAAHLLVGGSPGLEGLDNNPPCINSDLAPSSKSALQLLRDAAPSPADVLNPGLDLVNGTLANGSVRDRLAQFHRYPELTAKTKTVEQFYKLNPADFAEARRYLAQEIHAFNRLSNAQIDVPASSSGPYKRFAGTGEPTELPPAAWAAQARYNTATPYYPDGLNGLIARVHDLSLRVLADPTTLLASDVKDAAIAPLALLEAGGEQRGTLIFGRYTDSAYAITIEHRTAERLRIVVGEDGLRCAVQGTIEGADCADTASSTPEFPCSATAGGRPSLSCLTLLKFDEPDFLWQYDSVNLRALQKSISNSASGLVPHGTHLYLVRPRDAGSPELPGNFEVLAGFSSPEDGESVTVNLVPTLEGRVGEVLAPSRKFCAIPQVSCAGKKIDARLPLEDELTNDNNGVESSWKHYLDLAKQAADEADQLGQDFINSSFNVTSADAEINLRQEEHEQRAQDFLQQVQSNCGTAIDSRKLLSLLTGSDGTTVNKTTSPEACPATACAEGYSCVSGSCLVSFADLAREYPNDPDLARLADCLDTTQQFPFVTLGDQDLCIFHSPGNQNDVCPAVAGLECPALAPKLPSTAVLTEPRCEKNLGTTTYPGDVATALHMFVPNPIDSVNPSACSAIRQLRAYPGDPTALNTLVSGGFMDPERVRAAVGSLTWKAKYGGYVDVLADGQLIYSTGSATTGPANTWPCAARASACPDPAQMSGLLCSVADCADPASTPEDPTPAAIGRAQINERLLRATLAASVMLGRTGKSWENLHSKVDLTVPIMPFVIPYGANCRPHTQKDFFWTAGSPPITHECSWYSDRPGPGSIAWVNTAGEVFLATERWKAAFVSTASNDPFNPAHAGGGDGEFRWASLRYSDTAPSAEDAQKYFWAGLSTLSGDGQLLAVLKGQVTPESLLTLSPSVATLPYPGLGGPGESTAPPGTGAGTAQPLPKVGGSDFLDGLEILCDASIAKRTGGNLQPADLATFENLEAAGEYLKMLSASLTYRASRMVFARIPKIAIDSNRESGVGAFPKLGGKMAEQVAALRSAMLQAQTAVPTIAGEMNAFGSELKSLRAQLEKGVLAGKIANVQFNSTIVSRLTECAKSVNIVSGALSFGVGTALTCANAAAQIVFAGQLKDLQQDVAAQDDVIASQDFAGKASQHARALQLASISLSEAAEQIDSAAAAIEGLKKDAQVDVARAVYTASAQSKEQAEQLHALGTLATAKQTRYKDAFKSAQQMAFFAKRAIEQRLGVQLSSMTDDLPLVDAPQKWEGNLCTMSGIDFASIQGSGGGDAQVTFSGDPARFSDGFLGDYVRKLGNLVESYRVENNFHEGSDVAVISLRDDILNVRAKCDVPSSNLLLQSGALDHPVWQPTNCASLEGTPPQLNCVRAVPVVDSNNLPIAPFVTADKVLSGTGGYKLRFGDEVTPPALPCQSGSPGGPCTWQAGAALQQPVTLQPGKYRFTWYTQQSYVVGAPYLAGARAGFVRAPDGTPVNLTYQAEKPGAAPSWNREVATFTVPPPAPGASSVYQVGFAALSCSTGPDGAWVCTTPETSPPTYVITVAAPMLELVPPTGPDTELRSFQRTGDDNTIQLDTCEDTTGAVFRSAESGVWKRQCVRLCDAGFSNNCADGPVYCYRQAEFGVSQSAIQNGKIFNFSGFARGNFNYRIDQLAVNLVGTGIRDCSGSLAPSTCSGGGFVSYSLDHTGPFFVRNFDGADFRAYLFDGHIEHAKALGSERYITNPLSSSDRGLLEDYERKELQGRPLDGNFALRIWEDPAVNFDAIQDVQLVLNYSYWTRFK